MDRGVNFAPDCAKIHLCVSAVSERLLWLYPGSLFKRGTLGAWREGDEGGEGKRELLQGLKRIDIPVHISSSSQRHGPELVIDWYDI